MTYIIRPMESKDRGVIKEILINSQVFTPEEIDCALELIDSFLNYPGQKDYILRLAADLQDIPLGYICYGKVPLTDAIYDLYWIVVDPRTQKKGVGASLIEYLADDLKKLQARKIHAETSSRDIYAKARSFYLRNNFQEVARLKDFYTLGDDKVIYERVV